MTPALFVGGLGVVLALIVWLASTLKTTPEGYTRIGTFDDFALDRVQRVLQRAAIRTIVEDHSGRGKSGGRIPIIHVYVPTPDAPAAIALLKKESEEWLRPAPPA
jgi:hypothetical protein